MTRKLKAEEVLTKPVLGTYASKSNACSENQGGTWGDRENMIQFSHQIKDSKSVKTKEMPFILV